MGSISDALWEARYYALGGRGQAPVDLGDAPWFYLEALALTCHCGAEATHLAWEPGTPNVMVTCPEHVDEIPHGWDVLPHSDVVQ
mgnify:CR=1 FL=1